MGGHFVESVKNARLLMSPQEAGDGLESLVEFEVQLGIDHQRGQYYEPCKRSRKPRDLKTRL